MGKRDSNDDERFRLGDINKHLATFDANLKGSLLEFKDGKRIPLSLTPVLNTYKLGEVEEIATKVYRHYEGERGTAEEIAYSLTQGIEQPWERKYHPAQSIAAGIFVLFLAGATLLFLFNSMNPMTGMAVSESIQIETKWRIFVGLMTVLIGFIVIKIFKK